VWNERSTAALGKPPPNNSVVIIGAGPAGLTTAYELSRQGIPTLVLEADQTVGGLARTVNYRGYLVDVRGRRILAM
jgi:protoporphyrinogen oxidase